MIWIWIPRSARLASTGVHDRAFEFSCRWCHARYAGSVRTQGHGSGRDLWTAQQRARLDAEQSAAVRVGSAICPACGKLPPSTLEGLRTTKKTIERRKALRLFVSLGVGVLLLAGIGLPASYDLATSPALLIVALSSAIAASALSFAIFSRPVTIPFQFPSGVWFSADPRQAAWFPAASIPCPVREEQPSVNVRWGAYVVTTTMSIVLLLGLVLYSRSFRSLYVVGPAVVTIDGRQVGRIETKVNGDDVAFQSFQVRTSDLPQVRVVTEGRTFDYRLDPAKTGRGWVIAPRARERGLCVTQVTTFYGEPRTGAKNDDAILNPPGTDLVTLDRAYDTVFRPSPPSLETNTATTRTALRGLSCNALAERRPLGG